MLIEICFLLLLKVTNIGKEVLCESCVVIPAVKAQSPLPVQQQPIQKVSPVKEVARSPTKATAQQHNNQQDLSSNKPNNTGEYDPNECAGCGDQLKEGQALIAIDRQWHIWCFR